jgi:hypothetical protein
VEQNKRRPSEKEEGQKMKANILCMNIHEYTISIQIQQNRSSIIAAHYFFALAELGKSITTPPMNPTSLAHWAINTACSGFSG